VFEVFLDDQRRDRDRDEIERRREEKKERLTVADDFEDVVEDEKVVIAGIKTVPQRRNDKSPELSRL